MILELCEVLGFNFGWYTHVKLTPKVNSDGQINEYPLCSFYISKIAKSIVAGVLVSAIIGWMIYSVI